jgi:putative FmdB family regulatory protein
MPTYDYKCTKCDKNFSKFVSIKEKDNVKCPNCNGDAKQLFTGFLYKKAAGSGDDVSSSRCTRTSCAGCKGC